MALVTSYWLCDILLVLIAAIGSLYVYSQKRFQHWKKRNVKHTNPKFPVGDMTGLGKTRNIGLLFRDIYNEYCHEKFIGMWMFFRPILVVNDVGLIKNVLIKDFQHFHDRGINLDTEFEPLNNHIFVQNGQQWRNLRVRLAPTFTSGKMKMMFPTLTEVAKKLDALLEKSIGQDVDMKEILSRYTTDVIASCAFGLETSCLENPDSEFRRVTSSLSKRSLELYLAGIALTISPKLQRFLRLRFVPKSANDFFIKIVKEVVDYRRQNKVERKDFMQLLIQLMDQGFVEDPDAARRGDGENLQSTFDINTATAQAFLFLVAGFETSSSTMDFATYELCKRPEIQEKVQKEIDSVMAKHEGKLTFEGIQEMHYLDMVVSEVLRMYPISPLLGRECTKDYRIPDTDQIIEKGTNLIIPIMGIHHDPKIYPDPEKFDPERFLPEAKAGRDLCAYMPFGEGPRMCIGNRFALMQIKTGLASVLSKFSVVVCEKTPIPLEFDMSQDLLVPKGGIHVRLEKRSS